MVSNLGKCRFQTVAVPNPGCHKTSAVPLVVTGHVSLCLHMTNIIDNNYEYYKFVGINTIRFDY